MRIFNLTDVHTDQLKKAEMCDKPVVFCRQVINPGEAVEVTVPERQKQALQQLVRMGVLAVDAPPPQYVVKKTHQKQMDPKVREQIEKRRRTLETRGG